MYIYFKDSEVVGLQPELVQFLDKARAYAETPFIITSGFRDLAHNAKVGGVPNSAHTKGLAVDLAVRSSAALFGILKGIFATGTPCFVEICRNHVHVDISKTNHPLNCAIWADDD